MGNEEIAGRLADRGEDDVTGDPIVMGNQMVTCVLGKYEIKVLLTNDGRFVDVLEVGFNQEFMDYRQKGMSGGFQDVERFYEEEHEG
jgi:hypothetical protein